MVEWLNGRKKELQFIDEQTKKRMNKKYAMVGMNDLMIKLSTE